METHGREGGGELIAAGGAWEVVCPVQEIIDSSSGKWEEEGAARVSREGRTCVWARELDREEEARCGGWLQ